MRWLTYRSHAGPRVGLLDESLVYALNETTTLLELLEDNRLAAAAEQAMSDPFEVLAFDGLDLMPLLQPRSIRDMVCFIQHIRNCQPPGRALPPVWEQMPAFYFSNVAAVIGAGDTVQISPGSSQFDFEIEIAAVIGQAGSDLNPDEAAECIAGYTIFCDWSARDLQLREMRLNLGPAKGKDGANTLGPILVTPDELADFDTGRGYSLDVRAAVNDELVVQGRADLMDWTFGEAIAYASRGTRIVPGDVIASGTVPNGCLFEQYVANRSSFRGWLQPGDVVRIEVEQLGRLEQAIAASQTVPVLRTLA